MFSWILRCWNKIKLNFQNLRALNGTPNAIFHIFLKGAKSWLLFFWRNRTERANKSSAKSWNIQYFTKTECQVVQVEVASITSTAFNTKKTEWICWRCFYIGMRQPETYRVPWAEMYSMTGGYTSEMFRSATCSSIKKYVAGFHYSGSREQYHRWCVLTHKFDNMRKDRHSISNQEGTYFQNLMSQTRNEHLLMNHSSPCHKIPVWWMLKTYS